MERCHQPSGEDHIHKVEFQVYINKTIKMGFIILTISSVDTLDTYIEDDKPHRQVNAIALLQDLLHTTATHKGHPLTSKKCNR